MIVETMSHVEVYAELEKDRVNLACYWPHRRDALCKMARRSNRFPIMVWHEYLSPRKVRYLMFAYIGGRNYWKHNAVSIIALHDTANGIHAYVSWIPGMKIIPTSFSPHFFQRYGERMGVEKTGIELIKHFFTQNHTSRDITDKRFMGKSVRWKGYDSLCICTAEGVCMGDVKDGVSMMRTFITYEMAGGIQSGEFDAARKFLKSTDEVIKESQSLSNS